MKNLIEKNIQIVFDDISGIMNVVLEGFITYERMINILQYELDMIQHYGIKNCLVDLKKIRVYAPGIPEYMSLVWFPQVMQEGVNKIAFILPEDVIGLMSMNKANVQVKNKSSFEIKYFSEKGAAIDWIKLLASKNK